MQLEPQAALMPAPSHYPELRGQRALVTGAGSEAGEFVARAFGAQGCRMLLQFGADALNHSSLPDEVRSLCGEVRVLPGDFRDRAGIERFASAAFRAFGQLDLVVNAVALPEDIGSVRSEAAFHAAIAEALRLPLQIGDVVIDNLRQSGHKAAIVTVQRTTSDTGLRALAIHGLAKAALERMTQAQARNAFDIGVRVYGLVEAKAPGVRDWDRDVMTDLDVDTPDVLDNVASAALFLASRRAAWLNGAVLSIGE